MPEFSDQTNQLDDFLCNVTCEEVYHEDPVEDPVPFDDDDDDGANRAYRA